MALIKCPECGKEFSETASVCPQCGYKKRIEEVKQKTGKGLKVAGVLILSLALLALIQFIIQSVVGIVYPKGTTAIISAIIFALLIWGAKALGLFGKKEMEINMEERRIKRDNLKAVLIVGIIGIISLVMCARFAGIGHVIVGLPEVAYLSAKEMIEEKLNSNNNGYNSSSNNQISQSNNTSSTKQINNEADFRAYINNKTFKSLSNNMSFKFKNSENTWYTGDGNPFGTMRITQIYSGGVFFTIYSPYVHSTHKFAFEISTNMLYDEEGGEYRMK